MSKNKLNIPIAGMHCRSCEILVEESLSQVSGVTRSVVNFKKSFAEIHYNDEKPNIKDIEGAIRAAGYSVGENASSDWISKNPEDYKDLGIAVLFLIGIAIIAKNLGFSGINLASGSNPSGLGVVFLVGITAGFSTCMALVGGLILGISARHAEIHPEATPMQKFRPHLFFNIGRIGGYAILGGILGSLGSVFQLSGGVLGFLTIVVGFVMLMLGMKLIGIFPKMENKSISLPKGVAKMFGIKKHEKEYSHKGSMITGALTFFLPCGFTQAMQLYAISTGSFTQGALIMGMFALGTAPGLLGVGGLTSVVKGIFAKRFFKFAGVLVIMLSLFNIANGYNLAGWQIPTVNSQQSAVNSGSDPNVKLENGVQVVLMTESSRGYAPNSFTIKKGVPVKWVINAQDPYSCASSLVMNKLNIRKSLKAGENVIEFTPSETGKLNFSCSMGMYTGSFNVVDGDGKSASTSRNKNTQAVSGSTCGAQGAASSTPSASTGGCGGSGGGCGGGANGGSGGCGGSGKPVVPTAGATEVSPSNATENAQIINATYTYNKDIQPNTFKVKAGKPVKFVVDVREDGSGCMSTIMVQGLYNQPQLLQGGSKLEMDFTPTKPGVYSITCAMGVPRGTITVE